MTTDKTANSLRSCLSSLAEGGQNDFSMGFPTTSAAMSSPMRREMTNKLGPHPQRDKRRFYVKKTSVALEHFKEWEIALGDAWYRHHNKVNNIVYYHCKHEPCYASMKAKVMLDFVQLYVTEEGHTHPPYPYNTQPASNTFSVDNSIPSFQTQSSGIYYDYAALSTKRRRYPEEQLSQDLPVMYRPPLYSTSMRAHAEHLDSAIAENRTTSLPSCSVGEDLGSILNRIEQSNQLNCSISLTTNGSASAIDVKPSIITSADEMTPCSTHHQQPNEVPCSSNSSVDADDKIVTIVSAPVERTLTPCAENASPNSSVSSSALRKTNNNSSTGMLMGGSKETDEDYSTSGSEDDLVDYSPVSVDIQPRNGENDRSLNATNDDLFRIIKGKIESQPAHKRLRLLRKLKRQLSYYVEMEEVRYLTSRVPASTKYEDIFQR